MECHKGTSGIWDWSHMLRSFSIRSLIRISPPVTRAKNTSEKKPRLHTRHESNPLGDGSTDKPCYSGTKNPYLRQICTYTTIPHLEGSSSPVKDLLTTSVVPHQHPVSMPRNPRSISSLSPTPSPPIASSGAFHASIDYSEALAVLNVTGSLKGLESSREITGKDRDGT